MIGTQPTGAMPGIVISATLTEGLRATVNGRPARLAIVTDDGQVAAVGDQVGYEALAVSINLHQQFWLAKGHLRVLSKPIEATSPV